jgi:hypothetical protein
MPNMKRMLPFALILPAFLGGCGLFVPEKDLFSNDNVPAGKPSPQGLFENMVVGHIRCELRNGVIKALIFPEVQWLRTWGATVTLKLTWDELSGLNPGVSLLTPFKNSQSFTLGLGTSGTAHATRIETIAFTYSFEELLAEGATPCDRLQNGVMIQSDLKISQFIYDKAVIAATGEATSKNPTKPPYSTLQEDITFVASYGGSITPTWKFTRITVNPNSTLFNATRSQTDDVLITLGPVAMPATDKSQAQLSQQTQILHNAALIGSATASSIQSQTH